MRRMFREKGISQQEVFRAADISDRYGYRIISGEKHTKQRDIIIKLCLAAHFSVSETNEALMLYGMSPLYEQNGRDELIRRAIEEKRYEIADLNEMLEKNGYEKLYDGKTRKSEEAAEAKE